MPGGNGWSWIYGLVCTTFSFPLYILTKTPTDEPEEPEFNVSRLWRDTASNSVWEGTTNVLASETVRHLTNGQTLESFNGWITDSISHISDNAFQTTLAAVWKSLKIKLTAGKDINGLASVLGVGRQLMFTIAWLISCILLALDAQRDGDGVASEVARRWVLEGQGIPAEFGFPELIYQRSALSQGRSMCDQKRTEWDCRIVWGLELPSGASTGYRAKI
jgi:hypothetical protein